MTRLVFAAALLLVLAIWARWMGLLPIRAEVVEEVPCFV